MEQPNSSGITAPGTAYRDAPGGQVATPGSQSDRPGAPGEGQGGAGGDPLGDFRESLSGNPELQKQLQTALGAWDDTSFGQALHVVDSVASEFVGDQDWSDLQRRQLTNDPTLVRIAHTLGKQLQGYSAQIQRLEAENAQLREALSGPGTQRRIGQGRQAQTMSEDELDVQENELFHAWSTAPSLDMKEAASRRLSAFQKQRYSRPNPNRR